MDNKQLNKRAMGLIALIANSTNKDLWEASGLLWLYNEESIQVSERARAILKRSPIPPAPPVEFYDYGEYGAPFVYNAAGAQIGL